MSKVAISYDLFISSPGDIKDEEEINSVRKVLDRFNREHRDHGIRILSVRWDSDIFLSSAKPIQSSIDEILDSCDFVVAIFHNFPGTPVDGYPSKTAKEILTSLDKGKQVFVYRLDKVPDDPTNRDYRKLLDFMDELRQKDVLVRPYSDCDKFESIFMMDLNLYYKKELAKKEIYYQSMQEVRKKGITHIKIGNASDNILKEKISMAKCVKILSTSARALLSSYGTSIVEMLRNQGILKILLPNPGSTFLEDVDKIEERENETDSIHNEFNNTMGFLKRSLQRSENKGTIYIGCAYSLLRQTEIICIDSNDQIWSWVTMTMPPSKAAGESLSFAAQSVRENASKTLAYLANDYFDRLWEHAESQKSIINFNDNQGIQWFYREGKIAQKFWLKKLDSARNNIYQSQSIYGKRCLIEVAAQHPLTEGDKPNEEFKKRLDMSISLYHNYKKEGIECYIYVPGSRHMENGVIDKVSLSAAGTKYLSQNGIPENYIYGDQENKLYKGEAGVYNSADECFVASKLWKDHHFGQMVCVCSPEQALRKAAHYIAFGVYPLIYTAPVLKPYHSYVEEMLHALPDVLFRDPEMQSEDSEFAVFSRKQRKPMDLEFD